MTTIRDISIQILPLDPGFNWLVFIAGEEDSDIENGDYLFHVEGDAKTWDEAQFCAFQSYEQAKRFIEIGL